MAVVYNLLRVVYNESREKTLPEFYKKNVKGVFWPYDLTSKSLTKKCNQDMSSFKPF